MASRVSSIFRVHLRKSLNAETGDNNYPVLNQLEVYVGSKYTDKVPNEKMNDSAIFLETFNRMFQRTGRGNIIIKQSMIRFVIPTPKYAAFSLPHTPWMLGSQRLDNGRHRRKISRITAMA